MSHVTRILVTGGSGILATALRDYFPLAHYHGRDTCDVTNGQQVRAVFQEVKPELVIHCAAVTSHNAEPWSYVACNVQGTTTVVGQAKKLSARVVAPSTDYLGAAREHDPVRPVNEYARSKLAAECVALAYPRSLVVRGSWYSRLDLSHAATDAYTSKLPVEKAAFYIATLAVSSLTGVMNVGGARKSYYEIALQFNERVTPVSRHQIKCGYQIPEDCSLNTDKLNEWLAA